VVAQRPQRTYFAWLKTTFSFNADDAAGDPDMTVTPWRSIGARTAFDFFD